MIQIVFAAPANTQVLAVPLPSLRRYGDFSFAGEVLPRQALRRVHDLLQGALRDDLAAVNPRAGTDIDNIIRSTHGVLIVLHDDQGISQIPQTAQRRKQLIVIPLVESDARLVQDIQHTHQRRADLRGKADTLRFAAGQRPRRAGEGQILQTDALQEAKTGANLTQNLLRNDRLRPLEVQGVKELQLLIDRHGAELHDGQPADRHRPGNIGQALTAAVRAGRGRHQLLQLLAHGIGLGLAVTALHIGHDTLKRLLQRSPAVAAFIMQLKLFALRAVQNHLAGSFRKRMEGRVEVEMIFERQGFEVHPRDGIVFDVSPPARLDRAVIDGQIGIRDDKRGIDLQAEAQARAFRTGAEGIIEGEQPRRKLRHGNTAFVAGVVAGKQRLLTGVGALDDDKPAAVGQGGFHAVRQSAGNVSPQNEAIHDQFDGMLLVFFQRDLLAQVIVDAVDAHAGKAAAAGVLQKLGMLALFAAHNGRQHLKTRSLGQGKHLIHDLIHALTADLPAAFRAVGRSRARPEQTQIVIDLRDRANSRTRVL